MYALETTFLPMANGELSMVTVLARPRGEDRYCKGGKRKWMGQVSLTSGCLIKAGEKDSFLELWMVPRLVGTGMLLFEIVQWFPA
ncbi:hypothetical protein Bpfe_029393 [Biomphalaria pfeifferi]|uniref:Uncharacterized protein n=1 Tax=Biomphalaria pfeifferi TaxID=112525 RepID=A0AAD8EVQ1_BIOPF|nr:hypothetical protein Bpfe_029393 [Biomphalaria pfeifferi]